MKQMLKPMSLSQLNAYQGPVWVEFMQFTSANGWQDGVMSALLWSERVFNGFTRHEYGKLWRCWEKKPSLKERAFAPWGG